MLRAVVEQWFVEEEMVVVVMVGFFGWGGSARQRIETEAVHPSILSSSVRTVPASFCFLLVVVHVLFCGLF